MLVALLFSVYNRVITERYETADLQVDGRHHGAYPALIQCHISSSSRCSCTKVCFLSIVGNVKIMLVDEIAVSQVF